MSIRGKGFSASDQGMNPLEVSHALAMADRRAAMQAARAKRAHEAARKRAEEAEAKP